MMRVMLPAVVVALLAGPANSARACKCRARGVTLLTAAAVAPEGHLAGYTELGLMSTGREHGQTWNTLVLPGHRGHGLGMWIKLANLEAARRLRPELRRVTTWNAEANQHMIAINEAIGFRPVRRAYEVALDVA